MSDTSAEALRLRGVSPVLTSYIDALTTFFAPLDSNTKNRLKKLVAKYLRSEDEGDDGDRLRTAVNRAMEDIEPLLPRIQEFFDRYSQDVEGPFRMSAMGSSTAVGLSDQKIVGHAWSAARNFVRSDDGFSFITLSDSPALGCVGIVEDIKNANAPYKALRKNPSDRGEAEMVASIISAVANLGFAAEKQSARDVVLALAAVSLVTPNGRSDTLQRALSSLEEMLSGEFRLSSSTSSSEMDEWIEAGFSADEAKEWLDEKMFPGDARIFKSAGIDPEQASQWSSYHAEEAMKWIQIGIVDPEIVWHCRKAHMTPEDVRSQASNINSLVAEWKRAGHRYHEFKAWAVHGISVSAAAPWTAIEPNFYLVQEWIDAGFTPADATEWKSRGVSKGKYANDWIDDGFTPEQAQDWSRVGVGSDMAAKWSQAGFSPEQTERWLAVGFSQWSISTGEVLPRLGRRKVTRDQPPKRR